MENITTKEKNKMALTYGLLLGLIGIVITSAVNVMVSNFFGFYIAKFIGYVLYLVAVGIFAARIKKANGGYMEFKEVFGAVFIMLLVGGFMCFLYNYLYINVIDKDFMNKIKMSTVHFMERSKVPEDQIEASIKKFDEQTAAAKTLNLGKNILAFCGTLVMDSLFGLIVCAIVKKSRPVFNN